MLIIYQDKSVAPSSYQSQDFSLTLAINSSLVTIKFPNLWKCEGTPRGVLFVNYVSFSSYHTSVPLLINSSIHSF